MVRSRRITLLVVIYVALDLANPMMPGAVQLVGASLETVAGCQSRASEIPGPAVPSLPRHPSMIELTPDSPIRPPQRLARAVLSAPARSCPSLEPSSPLAPTCEDD